MICFYCFIKIWVTEFIIRSITISIDILNFGQRLNIDLKFLKKCLICQSNNNIMKVSEQEIQQLKNFVFLLNSKVDSAVIVEGKKILLH